jgi:hypothetical protein
MSSPYKGVNYQQQKGNIEKGRRDTHGRKHSVNLESRKDHCEKMEKKHSFKVS